MKVHYKFFTFALILLVVKVCPLQDQQILFIRVPTPGGIIKPGSDHKNSRHLQLKYFFLGIINEFFKKITKLIFPLSVLMSGCNQKEPQENKFKSRTPQIVEAKGYKVPLEKMKPPIVVPLSGLKSRKAGKPEIIRLKKNIFAAYTEKYLFKAESIKSFTPGNDGLALPRVVAITDSPHAAGNPEIIVVNDPYIKDNNPESFSSYNTLHGLKSNIVASLCEDRAGNLWMGNWEGNGVTKFDGRRFVNYSTGQWLNSDYVQSILEDRAGNIWLGTTQGAIKFDGRSFVNYSTANGLSGNVVSNFLDDRKGNIWIATNDGGLNKYAGDSITHYTTDQGIPHNRIHGLCKDSKGYLWFGTNGGVLRFDGNAFDQFSPALGMPGGEYEVSSILEDKIGNLWFATNKFGLFKYDGQYVSHFTTKEGLSSNNIGKMIEDQNGNLWISTWDGKLNRYDGKSFTHFGEEDGFSDQIVISILEDRSGTIWLGTGGGGIFRHDGKLFTHIQSAQGLTKGSIGFINTNKEGELWIGLWGHGVNKYDGNSIFQYTTRQGLASEYVYFVFEDRVGATWIASRSGVDKFSGGLITNYSTRNGLLDNTVYHILEDRLGNLWFATGLGASKFDGKSFTQYSGPQGLISQSVFRVFEDHAGNIWFGTQDMGAYRFDRNTFTRYSKAEGLKGNMISSISEDQHNNIWLGTNEGANKFDGKYFTHYGIEQGLSSNVVKNIMEDNNGDIWFGTVKGLNAIKSGFENVFDTAKNEGLNLFKKYTQDNGFWGKGTYDGGLVQVKDGTIWIGATDRVTIYHAEGDTPDTIPPTIQLTGLKLFEEPINWLNLEDKKDTNLVLENGTRLRDFDFSGLSRWHNQPENPGLVYNNNYLTFQFIGVTLNRPREVRYQYFLEGLDESWSSLTEKPEATYNNLPHGSFTFRVKAVNSEGHWSKELNYTFTIHPPWWRTWWAYLIYVSGFTFPIWAFTWYRSRRLKAENVKLEDKINKRTNELEQSLEERYRLSKKIESQQALLNERLRISRELHDDIGSTLGSISIYSEVAKKRTEKNENTNEVLSKIGLASRQLIDKMSDIVWSLNSNNENFEPLQSRMLAFATLILAPKNILYDFITDEELRKMQLTSGQSKNIFLIFKEALYNLVKYADCKKAEIILAVQNNDLIMIIRDNGKGFDASRPAATETVTGGDYVGGNGIKNMQARADEMKAKLCINSKINEGTTVQLSLHL